MFKLGWNLIQTISRMLMMESRFLSRLMKTPYVYNEMAFHPVTPDNG